MSGAGGAQIVYQLQQLFGSSPNNDQYYGGSVTISDDGNTIAIGAPGQNHSNKTKPGAVFVYVKTGATWVEQQMVIANDPDNDAQFGYNMAMSADGLRLAVHAFRGVLDPFQYGAVYICDSDGTNWTQTARIVSATPSLDGFGNGLALSGDGFTLAVGANFYNGAFTDDGHVEVWTGDGTIWGGHQTLVSPTPAANDQLGIALALSSDGSRLLATGAQGFYSFVKSGSWSMTHFEASPPGGFVFTSEVKMSADGLTAVFGDIGQDNGSGFFSGAAFVYSSNGTAWALDTTLIPSDPNAEDQFGAAVAISSDSSTIMVSAPMWDDTTGTNSGKGYIFKDLGSGWVEVGYILQDSGRDWARLGDTGLAMSADGSVIAAGAREYWDGGANSTGTAWIWDSVNNI